MAAPQTTNIGELIDHAHALSLELTRYRGHDASAVFAMTAELDETWSRIAALRTLSDIAAPQTSRRFSRKVVAR